MSAIGVAGSKIFMGVYSAAQAFSSISNASEAVLSFASNPSLSANDLFKLDGGWSEVAGNIYRAKSPSGSGPYLDRKSTRLNSSHSAKSRMPSSA